MPGTVEKRWVYFFSTQTEIKIPFGSTQKLIDLPPPKEHMRFFRHGDVLAITLPESLRKKLGIAENDEYDFAESEEGVLKLVRKSAFGPAAQKEENTPNQMGKTEQPRQASAKEAGFQSAALQTNAATQKPANAAGMQKPGSAQADTQKQRFNPLPLGFMVIELEDEAKAFSRRFERDIKSGEIMGVRGFDKKFYLASRGFFEHYADRLFLLLATEKTPAELATATKLPPNAVQTLLFLLQEAGEVIEKRKGRFVRVL